MEINKKSQQSGDNGINIQTECFTLNTGLSIAHVKEIALEVFEGNFYKLTGVARETAGQRAREITDQFIKELAEKNPEGVKAAEDPDFQYSLFIAQKEYARRGDKELGDILVDILVDRTAQDQDGLLKIVLNEAISVAPKLTSEQLDILACCFIMRYTKSLIIRDIGSFKQYIGETVIIFSGPIGGKQSNYNHLEFVGCAAIRTGSVNLIQILIKRYQAIFCKGYAHEAIKKIEVKEPNIVKVHIPCLHDNNLIQAGGGDDDTIREMCRRSGISDESMEELIQINKEHMMNEQEAKEFLNGICPGFAKFLEDATSTPFIHMELTSVGIAIAHAHARKKAEFDADLSIWI